MRMATVNPKMTSVSGITSRMIIVPSDSGFSRRAPTTAAPIRACANPVARAANPIARPAPSPIKPISMSRPPFPACRPSCDRSKRMVGATAADEKILEELHVVEANGLDRWREHAEREVDAVERQPGEDPQRGDSDQRHQPVGR